jgi:hypothetical protein
MKPTSCQHVILFRECQWHSGNKSSSSLGFLLQILIFYIERYADRFFSLTVLLKKWQNIYSVMSVLKLKNSYIKILQEDLSTDLSIQNSRSQHKCKVFSDKEKHHTLKATEKISIVYHLRHHIGLCLEKGSELYHLKWNY